MATAAFNTVVSVKTGGAGSFATLEGVNSASFTFGKNIIDVSTLTGATGDFRKRLGTLRDFPMSISGFFLPSDTGYQRILAQYTSGTQTDVKFDFSGGSTFTVQVVVESIEISVTPDGAQEVSISLQSTSDFS